MDKKYLEDLVLLEAEVKSLKEIAERHLEKAQTIYAPIAQASSDRFAIASKHFAIPENPCVLTKKEEKKLRKEYNDANWTYQKASKIVRKKQKYLDKKQRTLSKSANELLTYIVSLENKIDEVSKQTDAWAKSYQKLEDKYNPFYKVLMACITLACLPLLFAGAIAKKFYKNKEK